LGRTHFNLKETEIIDNEIYTNLLPKGIIKQIEYDKDVFVSNIPFFTSETTLSKEFILK
jgi:hypothetical protein